MRKLRVRFVPPVRITPPVGNAARIDTSGFVRRSIASLKVRRDTRPVAEIDQESTEAV